MILPPLYHWAPAKRYHHITGGGLQVGCSPTVNTSVVSYVCLGFDPASAWLYSGAQRPVDDAGLWDLWQVHLADGDQVEVRAEMGPRMQEVRVSNPIPADRMWWVARRD